MDTLITVLLGLFTAGTLTIAALLALATWSDRRETHRRHKPGQVIDQFGSEKGITR